MFEVRDGGRCYTVRVKEYRIIKAAVANLDQVNTGDLDGKAEPMVNITAVSVNLAKHEKSDAVFLTGTPDGVTITLSLAGLKSSLIWGVN